MVSPDPTVVLLTRAGCHTCVVALARLQEVCSDFAITPTSIDVDEVADTAPDLRAEFGDRVPVVLLDGRELPLDPAALSCDADGQLWVLLPEGEKACFTAAAQLELSAWLTEQAGVVGVQIRGDFSAIAGAGAAASAGPLPKPGS